MKKYIALIIVLLPQFLHAQQTINNDSSINELYITSSLGITKNGFGHESSFNFSFGKSTLMSVQYNGVNSIVKGYFSSEGIDSRTISVLFGVIKHLPSTNEKNRVVTFLIGASHSRIEVYKYGDFFDGSIIGFSLEPAQKLVDAYNEPGVAFRTSYSVGVYKFLMANISTFVNVSDKHINLGIHVGLALGYIAYK
ncbi:MAG: hypothetical protein ACNS60_03055 [Candidatus Cyclobacteriaceae bacterium M2_1C_046]